MGLVGVGYPHLPPSRSMPLVEERQSEKAFALCFSRTSEESTLGTLERVRVRVRVSVRG